MNAKIEELKAKILAIEPDADVSRPTSTRSVMCSNGQDAEQVMFFNGVNTVGDMRRFIDEQDDDDLITFGVDYDDKGTLVTIEEVYEYSDEEYIESLQTDLNWRIERYQQYITLPSGRFVYLSESDKEYIKGL